MKLYFSCLLFVAMVVSTLATGCSTSNGCEAALQQTIKLTTQICDQPAYHSTPFCSTCVAAGRFSTTGPADCRCTFLAFDQGMCTYPSDDDATAQIQGAIDWANEACLVFSIGSTDGSIDAAGTDGGAEVTGTDGNGRD
jgi:hypothetical protein